MPRKNHPEKRKPSQKKMRRMIRKEMEKEKKFNQHKPGPIPEEDEYGF